jgi:hypothetical protein
VEREGQISRAGGGMAKRARSNLKYRGKLRTEK